jgi:hypothetical protein
MDNDELKKAFQDSSSIAWILGSSEALTRLLLKTEAFRGVEGEKL